jgi:hypothetical protein
MHFAVALQATSAAAMHSDIFQIPFGINQGTNEENVGMSVDAPRESLDS